MLHQQKVQVGTVFCWRNVLLTVVTLNHFFIVPRRKIGAIYRFLNYLKTLPFPPCCYSWQRNTGNLELFFMLANTFMNIVQISAQISSVRTRCRLWSLRIVSTDLYVVFLYKDTEKIKICLNCYVDKVIAINTICDSVIHLVARMIQKINPKQER